MEYNYSIFELSYSVCVLYFYHGIEVCYMCGFNCVNHDLNYATMEDQWLIKRKTQNNFTI